MTAPKLDLATLKARALADKRSSWFPASSDEFWALIEAAEERDELMELLVKAAAKREEFKREAERLRAVFEVEATRLRAERDRALRANAELRRTLEKK